MSCRYLMVLMKYSWAHRHQKQIPLYASTQNLWGWEFRWGKIGMEISVSCFKFCIYWHPVNSKFTTRHLYEKSSEIALGIQFTWSWFEWNNSNIREMRWKVLPNNTLRHLRKKWNWMLIDGETQQTLSVAGFTGFLFRWFLSVSDHNTKCTTCQIFNCF